MMVIYSSFYVSYLHFLKFSEDTNVAALFLVHCDCMDLEHMPPLSNA